MANVQAGPQARFDPGAVVGYAYRDDCGPAVFGTGARVRHGTIIYGDVRVGDDFQTGHHALIREHTTMGSHVVVGSHTVVDGHVRVGDFVKIETACYLPPGSTLGRRVFLGPRVTLTNDRYPLKQRDQYRPEGPTIEDGVTLGAACVILPGVTVGRGSFVAAGAVVTKDVPAMTLAIGHPARFEKLPAVLRERNIALSWRKWLETDDNR